MGTIVAVDDKPSLYLADDKVVTRLRFVIIFLHCYSFYYFSPAGSNIWSSPLSNAFTFDAIGTPYVGVKGGVSLHVYIIRNYFS